MPLAFFCTLFFRHRKKSVSAPWDGSPTTRAVVGASILRRGSRIMSQSGAFHAPDPLGAAAPLPLRSRRVNPRPGQRVCVCGRTKGLFARLFGNLRAPKLESPPWNARSQNAPHSLQLSPGKIFLMSAFSVRRARHRFRKAPFPAAYATFRFFLA